MNDPHVAHLRYSVGHDDSVDYENAGRTEHENEYGRFTIEGDILTWEPTQHYASIADARADVEDYLRSWELDAALSRGRGEFHLKYLDARVVDRDPTPGVTNIQAALGLMTTVALDATAHVSRRTYPPPVTSSAGLQISKPSGGVMKDTAMAKNLC